jgi:Pyridoxal phosphate biosynthesis protein
MATPYQLPLPVLAPLSQFLLQLQRLSYASCNSVSPCSPEPERRIRATTWGEHRPCGHVTAGPWGTNPDPLAAAVLVELAGADGIVVHLREDRRHIQDRDLRLLRELIRPSSIWRWPPMKRWPKLPLSIKPDMVTLVPEQRQELTTEGGLDVAGHRDRIQQVVTLLHDGGIPVSLFIEPDLAQIKASHRVSADFVELHTGRYANARARKKPTQKSRPLRRPPSSPTNSGWGSMPGTDWTIAT